jgi:3-oxoacyl-[acyl-carrier-protein] synthase II
MQDRRRVVVTGFAPVTNLGIGADNFFSGLQKAEPVLEPVPERWEKKYSYKSRFFSPLPEFEIKDYGLHSNFASIQTRADKMVLLGAKLALEHAGVELESLGNGQWSFQGSEDCDILLGTGIASLKTAMKSFMAHVQDDLSQVQEAVQEKVRVNRMVVPMTMVSSPAAWAAKVFSIGGAVHTINASCASGTIALGEAFLRIASGNSKMVLSGGYENLQDGFGGIMRGFDMLGALTCSEDGHPRPYTHERSGFLFSEGAAGIIILEEMEHAQARGAEIYAEIVNYRQVNEHHSIVQIDPSGDGIRRLLKPLAEAYHIDAVNVHGTGTQANDAIESELLQEIFPHLPPVQLGKSSLGHSIAASGALEIIQLIGGIKEGIVNQGAPLYPGNDCPIVSTALSQSFGFGGHNAALVVRSL